MNTRLIINLTLLLFLFIFVGCGLTPVRSKPVKNTPRIINKEIKYISCVRILNREGVRQELIGGFCSDALKVR